MRRFYALRDTVEVVAADNAFHGEVGAIDRVTANGVYVVKFPSGMAEHFAWYELRLSQQKLL